MKHAGTAIFIEPQGTLLTALLERKGWLHRHLPGQPYCDHPPHCTLLFGEYGPVQDWLAPLHQAVAAISAVPIETFAWQQFPQDILAGGGHTVAYRVRLTPSLARLQQTVAEILAPFRATPQETHPLATLPAFAQSWEKFGFPFVGPHWIPHFTIGAPLVPADSPWLAQLMTGEVQHRELVRSISLWQVDGDRHSRLHELALAME